MLHLLGVGFGRPNSVPVVRGPQQFNPVLAVSEYERLGYLVYSSLLAITESLDSLIQTLYTEGNCHEILNRRVIEDSGRVRR